MTRNKTIWLTETGVLVGPGAIIGGAPVSLARVRNEYLNPMVNWFKQHITPAGDASYINGVAWYTTYWADFPYTNLLTADGATLTVVGEAWRDAQYPACECPGPDCTAGW